jgi:hypothetical protein
MLVDKKGANDTLCTAVLMMYVWPFGLFVAFSNIILQRLLPFALLLLPAKKP